jgi:formylglycine-generating enzyme required for sulfatase activity
LREAKKEPSKPKARQSNHPGLPWVAAMASLIVCAGALSFMVEKLKSPGGEMMKRTTDVGLEKEEVVPPEERYLAQKTEPGEGLEKTGGEGEKQVEGRLLPQRERQAEEGAEPEAARPRGGEQGGSAVKMELAQEDGSAKEQRRRSGERMVAEEDERQEAARRGVKGKRIVEEEHQVRAEPLHRPDDPAWKVKEKLGIELVRIPGGEFEMGQTDSEKQWLVGEVGEQDYQKWYRDERPSHRVQVRDFYLGKHEVTKEQWRHVMGSDPSYFTGCDTCPVDQVSWEDIQKFLRKAADIAGVEIRLPTEAEWEYAARGGAQGQRWAGTDNQGVLTDYAWYSPYSEHSTHPVGGKEPNAYGLHDMSGNVWEWCSDGYDSTYYSGKQYDNPEGPSSANYRVFRGGGWNDEPRHVRSADRNGYLPSLRSAGIGFRVVLPATK